MFIPLPISDYNNYTIIYYEILCDTILCLGHFDKIFYCLEFHLASGSLVIFGLAYIDLFTD